MIKPGFVSAILPDLSLQEVAQFAAEEGFSCAEVEDRAYEGSPENRKASLRQSGRYLKQFLP